MSYVDKYVPMILGIICACWLLKGVFSALGGSVPEKKSSNNSNGNNSTGNSNNESGGI